MDEKHEKERKVEEEHSSMAISDHTLFLSRGSRGLPFSVTSDLHRPHCHSITNYGVLIHHLYTNHLGDIQFLLRFIEQFLLFPTRPLHCQCDCRVT